MKSATFLSSRGRHGAIPTSIPPDRRADRGALFENFLFTELCKHLPRRIPIRYWRTSGGAEVGFVIEHGDRRVAVEAKVKAAPGRLPRSAHRFISAYAPRAFWTVHLGASHRAELDGTELRWLHPVELASALAEVTHSAG